MGTAAELSQALSSATVTEIARQAIDDSAADYLNANRAQMMEGKGKAFNIGRYRPPTGDYARFKNELSATAGLGNVDLRLTGSFQDKMKLEVSGDDILISSDDPKEEGLIKNYGAQIYGLNDKNQREYNEGAFTEAFFKVFEAVTGLKR